MASNSGNAERPNRGNGITTVEQLRRKYFVVDSRAEENKRVFYDRDHSYETEEDAVGRIMFDLGWWTNYNWELVYEFFQYSAYADEWDAVSLWNKLGEGYREQNGRYYPSR